jgi:hypothetical protein
MGYVNCYGVRKMEDSRWKTHSLLQTGESEKVHSLGLQPMRQENDVVYTYRLLSIKMQILRSSQYKDMYVR